MKISQKERERLDDWIESLPLDISHGMVKACIREAFEDGYEKGYSSGYGMATSEAIQEINKNYQPNDKGI